MSRINAELSATRKSFVRDLFKTDKEITYDMVQGLIKATLPGGMMSPNTLVAMRGEIHAERLKRAKKARKAQTVRKVVAQPTLEAHPAPPAQPEAVVQATLPVTEAPPTAEVVGTPVTLTGEPIIGG